jgi:hypothetical protein
MLRRWLRQVENLRRREENVVYICGPKDGESLIDEEGRSTGDITNF